MVDLEHELGEIETPEKQRGSETHEKAAEDAEEAPIDEIWGAIERGERQILLESSFVGEAGEFTVIGIPDAVIFEDRKPTLLFDRKTTSIPDRLFKNQRIQVWLYGYMLQSLGFDVSELTLAILTHEQQLDPLTGKQLQKLILGEVVEGKDERTELMTDPKAYCYFFHLTPLTTSKISNGHSSIGVMIVIPFPQRTQLNVVHVRIRKSVKRHWSNISRVYGAAQKSF